MKFGVVVGHVPKKITLICSLFLRRGGAIHCRVTGVRRYSADLQHGGLEIPCILKFEVDTKGEQLLYLLDKTQKLVSSAFLFKDDKTQSSKQLHLKEECEATEDEVPETKKMKLFGSETLIDWQRDIIKGEMLSDIPINVAQRLLKKQFPYLTGLQPTVYQQKNQIAGGTMVENQLQIIHSRGNHWIVASSVGCIEGTVNIYDSLYTSLDETVVSSLFHARTNMRMQPMQKQVGGTDCGLFAIAVISAIAYGIDPSQLQFKQEEMREHLLNCFKNDIISLQLIILIIYY